MVFSEYVKIRQERFGAVIFDTLREKIFVTNQTGSDILQLIEDGKEISELTVDLKKFYSQDLEFIEKDIRNFVEGLRKNNLIK